jgi:hypothetical protein
MAARWTKTGKSGVPACLTAKSNCYKVHWKQGFCHFSNSMPFLPGLLIVKVILQSQSLLEIQRGMNARTGY